LRTPAFRATIGQRRRLSLSSREPHHAS
jgi:hypothetical protein